MDVQQPVLSTNLKREIVTFAANFLNTAEYVTSSPCEIFEIASGVSKSQKAAVAYVVNFGEGIGHVIVAADSELRNLVAERHHGSSVFYRNQITDEFIASLIEEMREFRSNKTRASGDIDGCVGHEHFFKFPIIETNITESNPYNRVVFKHHPRCKVGTAIASCIAALSYCMEGLSYKGFYYNFPSINKCIIKGNEYTGGIKDDVMPTAFTFPDLSFSDTYKGAIDGMAQLMWDFGSTINTNYGLDYSTANLIDAYNIIKTFDVEITPFYASYNHEQFMKMFVDDYLIIGMFEDTTLGRAWCGIVEGGEIIYYSSKPEAEDRASIKIYRVDRSHNSVDDCDNVIIDKYSEYNGNLKFLQFFGIKILK